MARIDFAAVHSAEVVGERFIIKALDASTGALQEISFDRIGAALLIPLLQQASRDLPSPDGAQQVVSLGFDTFVDLATGQPGLLMHLTEKLAIPFLLGQPGLDALRACICPAEPGSPPRQPAAH